MDNHDPQAVRFANDVMAECTEIGPIFAVTCNDFFAQYRVSGHARAILMLEAAAHLAVQLHPDNPQKDEDVLTLLSQILTDIREKFT